MRVRSCLSDVEDGGWGEHHVNMRRQELQTSPTRLLKPTVPETLSIAPQIVESRLCSRAPEALPGLARIFAPALLRTSVITRSCLLA